MEKIKKIILLGIPMSICNFRCHYCYLSQRDECYQNVQPTMQYTPKQVRKALSKKRIGGTAFFNICADGETLLTKDIDLYVKEILEEGHFVEIVSNMSIIPMLDKILSFDKELLKHLEFKCSFHYLELKEKDLLLTFANNVNRAWKAGASVTIEVAPSDELIPYIEELKEFSIEHFGALPHLTILRNDRTNNIDYLTQLSIEEYDKLWSQFDSDFWKFKKTIFGKKQTDYCYAGFWSVYVNLATGDTSQCYNARSIGNVFENPEKDIEFSPVGKCKVAHCYNGHALLTLGLIPDATDVRYGSIRDRVRADGTHWLYPELLEFFNTQCVESNALLSKSEKAKYKRKFFMRRVKSVYPRAKRKLHRIIHK